MPKGKIFIVSAPSGAGKTTLTNYVVQHLKAKYNISKIITYTTRQPRHGEIPSIDYNFITTTEFEEKLEKKFFLETTKYNGNFYGSPASIIEDINNGKNFIIIVDRVGAKNLKTLISNPILIWLTVPSVQILESRMKERGEEHVINERIDLARKEILEEEQDPEFTHKVINIDFESAAHEIIEIIKKELS